MAVADLNVASSVQLLDQRTLASCFWLTIAFELLTIVLRWGFDLQVTRDTASTVGVLTFGIRIHHLYMGALLIPIAVWWFRRKSRPVGKWLFIIGVAAFFSDLVHHFLVMWPITGDPHFHLFYPTE